ncbi:hypothetical protein QU481_03240 [Crenobacter sp. SG2303]|uniref:CNP1-like uncharacterized domain-containing protein n=1 Tax=Crenobacter oryzisoli TaxID=3056844 RepID=A0ABT7XJD2_9NEIS|nr:hypothetical protein [Crenobacter sp. SG2303]MDN0073906.1 hypothetical protein [Crenobacter sp. SG2303]
MEKKSILAIKLIILFLLPGLSEATCPTISDGIYVPDDTASEVGKPGKYENIIRNLQKTDQNLAATTLGFSVALLKNKGNLILFRTIGNDINEQYTTLSIRAEYNHLSCTESDWWTLQTNQYYPEELNFLRKPRKTPKKLPTPLRMLVKIKSTNPKELEITGCKTEVQEAGKWRPYGKYDAVDLCTNLVSSKLFDIRPLVQGRPGWKGLF